MLSLFICHKASRTDNLFAASPIEKTRRGGHSRNERRPRGAERVTSPAGGTPLHIFFICRPLPVTDYRLSALIHFSRISLLRLSCSSICSFLRCFSASVLLTIASLGAGTIRFIQWCRGVFAPLHLLNTSAALRRVIIEVYPCRLALPRG